MTTNEKNIVHTGAHRSDVSPHNGNAFLRDTFRSSLRHVSRTDTSRELQLSRLPQHGSKTFSTSPVSFINFIDMPDVFNSSSLLLLRSHDGVLHSTFQDAVTAVDAHYKARRRAPYLFAVLFAVVLLTLRPDVEYHVCLEEFVCCCPSLRSREAVHPSLGHPEQYRRRSYKDFFGNNSSFQTISRRVYACPTCLITMPTLWYFSFFAKYRSCF